MNKYQIDFQPLGKRGIAPSNQTILELAQLSGLGLASICGGTGTCQECRIQLIAGLLSPPTSMEVTALGTDAITSGWRLACQVYPMSDVRIHIPPESLTTPQRLQTEGDEAEVTIDTEMHEPGTYGLAIDLGTTKLAAYLMDLHTGKTVAKIGSMNPQLAYGEDVVSRIAFSERKKNGGKDLQILLVNTLNQMVTSMCSHALLSRDSIVDVVMVGNTAMHHLAAGLPVKQLGFVPFSPSSIEPLNFPATQLGMMLNKDAQIYLPPVIAGYVGSDHLAMLLTIGIEHGLTKSNPKHQRNSSLELSNNSNHPTLEKNIIAIDIGTNTEISLLSGGKITSCSCASGPAFEGAHIKEGMRAAPGAIERAQWSNGKILWQTIDSQPPIGICGSGILDLISALLEGGFIKSSGKLTAGDSISVVSRSETGLDRDLLITRRDIHEIQLAKSAIQTGIEVLLSQSGLQPEALDEFIVAGAFGTYLNSNSAKKIGMFPPIKSEIIRQIGNAAGMGAKQMLVSRKKRNEAELLAKKLTYLELASNKRFLELFIKNLSFSEFTFR